MWNRETLLTVDGFGRSIHGCWNRHGLDHQSSVWRLVVIEVLRSRENLISLAVGFVFGIGPAISGMTQPGKVIGFLDFTGNWDPSLIFVMGRGRVCICCSTA